VIEVRDEAVPAYRDPSLPPSARVTDLLGRMTLREKVGQLNQRLLEETTLRYVDTEARALFPFGAGLGYGRWRLGPPTASAAEVTADGLAQLTVDVPLAYHGTRPGTQVVQLYGRMLVPGLVPRTAVLVGFTRLERAPGADLPVRIPVLRDALPGLGIGPDLEEDPAAPVGVIELWCSLDGPERAGADAPVVRVRVRGVP
jgi:beta-glucosidase